MGEDGRSEYGSEDGKGKSCSGAAIEWVNRKWKVDRYSVRIHFQN
jgi:hypothetical protein